MSSENVNPDQIQSQTNSEEDSGPVTGPDHEQANLEERNETKAGKCLRRSERSHRRPAYPQDFFSQA